MIVERHRLHLRFPLANLKFICRTGFSRVVGSPKAGGAAFDKAPAQWPAAKAMKVG